ncbi:hypothetical protein A2U01_0045164, partial [Trifolium medium]|nr:hypothetical protein [Trifolium medium]
MSDLYLSENPFKSSNVELNVTASSTSKSVANVDASGNASETLRLEKPRSDENLGKSDLNPLLMILLLVKPLPRLLMTLLLTNDVQNVTPSGQTFDKPDDVIDATASDAVENLENDVPDTTEDVPATGNEKSPNEVTIDEENWSEDHTVVNSHSDESMMTISGDKEDSVPADQGKNDDNDVVNIDDLES